MTSPKRSKPAIGGTTGGLRNGEQLELPLDPIHRTALEIPQNASCHVIYVSPAGHGRSEVRYADRALCVSRQPLLDAARLLLALGCNPKAIIAQRRIGSNKDDLWAPLGVAAQYTVDEYRTIFARWKPFPQSAVSPRSENNGARALWSRPANKTARAIDPPTSKCLKTAASDLEGGDFRP
jgi:hypothetical protein